MSISPPTVSLADYPLIEIRKPHAHDVLCGRGGGTNNHIGNNHWRALVAANKQLYTTLPNPHKSCLSRSIVSAVREQHPPGRFLNKDKNTDFWYDVGDEKAREKTSQALRENTRKNQEGDASAGTASTQEGTTENSNPAPKVFKTNSALGGPKTTLVPPYPPPASASATSSAPASNGSIPPAPPISSPGMMQFSPGQLMAMEMYAGMMQQQQQQQSSGTMSPAMMQQLMSTTPQNVTSSSNSGGRKRLSQEEKSKYAEEAEKQAKAGSSSSTQTQQQQLNPHQQQHPNMPSPPPPGVRFDFETMASMVQPLEPTGISFGSISMTSMEHSRLQPTGTSFGSTSMASAPRVAPVDGGLEPSGLSHGSQFSSNSAEHRYIQNVILEPTPLCEDENAPLSFQTPTLFEQQRSRGNLLDCSDTESEDDPEETVNSTDKAEEWKKVQDTVQQLQGVNGNTNSAMEAPKHNVDATDGPAETEFARDISAMSAISLMSLEPYTTRGSSGIALPPELNQEVSVAFSEMSLSRDVSLTDPLAVQEDGQEKKPPPSSTGGEDDSAMPQQQEEDLTDEEKLQKLFLSRGGSLAFESFGRSEKGSA